MTTSTIESYSSDEACRLAGITYRQADYWTRRGLIEPMAPATGSGSRRRWSAQDVLVLRVIHRLMVLRMTHVVIQDAIALLDRTPDLLWVRGQAVSAGDSFDFLADLQDLAADEFAVVISPKAMAEDLPNRG